MNKMSERKDAKIHVKILYDGEIVFEQNFEEFPISIGRSRDNHIPLIKDNLLSRKHAQIDWDGEQLVLRDLNSSNGLFENKKRIQSLTLDSDKVVKLGEVEIFLTPQYFSETFPLHGDETVVCDNDLTEFTKSTDISNLPELEEEYQSYQIQKGNKNLKVDSSVAQVNTEPAHDSISSKKNFKPSSFAPINQTHQDIGAFSKSQMNLEMIVTWKGQLYQSRIFQPGEAVKLGRGSGSTYLPILKKEYHLADYNGNYVHCYLNKDTNGEYIIDKKTPQSLQKIIPSLPKSRGRHCLKINPTDLCHITLGEDVGIFLRYTPSPRQLTKNRIVLPEELLKKTIVGSSVGHLMAIIFMFFLAPREPDIRIKNLSPRVARLLVQKPKPKEKPKIQVKKEEKKKPDKVERKIVQKKKIQKKVKVVKKKIIRKPQKVVVRKSQKMRKINEKATRVIKKKPSVTSLGALAALGRSKSSRILNKPLSLNINPKAGGASSKSKTRGIIGALKTKNGRLAYAGMNGVKTKGKGYGKGSGYGVQGLKGRAGSRGVVGVVTEAKLLKVKSTEGLTKNQVMKEVQRHIGKIQSCYERALLGAPGISGRVEYEWHITPKGKVKWSKVKNSEINNGGSLNNCVKKVFKKMAFPIAKNGESTIPSIGFPFGRL